MPHIRFRPPTPATVLALIALFVALGGTGYALSRIDGSKLKARSVAGKKLRKNTVTGAEVKESKLKAVPNALRLAGQGPGEFVQGCGPGSVHGFARIKASPSFPAAFTDSSDQIDLPFHCGGGKVSARRVSAGVYHVHFDAPVGALGFASAEGGTTASVTGLNDPAAAGADKYSFEVEVRESSGQSRPSDTAFSLLVL